jgi:hypothetical protein
MFVFGTSLKLFEGSFNQFDGWLFAEEETVLDEFPGKHVQVHQALSWRLHLQLLFDKHAEDISKMDLTYDFYYLWQSDRLVSSEIEVILQDVID